MALGPHAFFIIASYALVGVTVLALIGWVIVDHMKLQAVLRELDAKGARRRSARDATPS